MSLLAVLACLPALIASPQHGEINSVHPKMISMIKRFETAFAKRRLNTFKNSGKVKIKITIEHSLVEPPEGVQPMEFDTFKQVETWLRSKEHGGNTPDEDLLPFREVRKRVFEGKGLFEYENQGISHNHLYLSSVRFFQTGDNFSIVEIALENGD